MTRTFAMLFVMLVVGLGQAHTIAHSTANGSKPFARDAFDAARAAGKTVLVSFHAPWCPVCKAQAPKVEALLNSEYTDVVAFNADFDTSLELRKEMNVPKQATLILFRGEKEIARLSFKSDDASIREFFSHAHPAAR